METKKIYLIRHGQTDFNLKGIAQGSGVDTDLNQTGIDQAVKFFNHHKDITFKKVYTSVLKRSIQSVQSFINIGIEHEAYDALNEIDWGNKDGKLVSIKDNTFYWDMVKKWRDGNLDFKIEGGESPLDVQRKQKPILDLILSRKEEDPILICMHGRAIRILLSTLIHGDLTQMDNFKHENLGLYLLEYNGKDFNVLKSNDRNHLVL